MKFSERLNAHIRRCKGADPADYVNYDQISAGLSTLTEEEFQQIYRAELYKLEQNVREGTACRRDPRYTEINLAALDAISREFIRVTTDDSADSEAESLILDALQIDEIPNLDHQPKKGPAGWLVFVAGAVSGIASRTLTAPLDRIKLMLQAGPRTPSGRPVIRLSDGTRSRLLATARALLKDGGVRGFWQGNGANLLKVVPESAVRFWCYDTICSHLTQNESQPTVSQRMFGGMVAGAVSQAVVYPLDVTKTRLAVAASGRYTGIWHCLQSTLREGGIRQLYRGMGVALLAIVPASGIDLTVYNGLRRQYLDKYCPEGSEKVPIRYTLAFGVASSTCGAVTAYPLTLIRTKLIAQGMPGMQQFNGPVDVVRTIVAQSGVSGLYRGLIPALLKCVPAMSIGYGAFEASKRLGVALGA